MEDTLKGVRMESRNSLYKYLQFPGHNELFKTLGVCSFWSILTPLLYLAESLEFKCHLLFPRFHKEV